MIQRKTIAPHDCVGSNLYAHVLRGTVKRIVPHANEEINESWISDRDRFSYEGIYSPERLTTPRVKENGEWRELDWESALDLLAQKLQAADGSKTGLLVSPGSTTEEAYLLARLAGHLSSPNIDHRLRQQDFSDQDNDPLAPWLGLGIADIENCDAVLVVGSNLRKEAPILAHRLRKAALAGAQICFANSKTCDYFFDVAEYLSGAELVSELAGVAVATGRKLPPAVADICKDVQPTDSQKHVASILAKGDNGLVLLGNMAGRDPAYAVIRGLAATIADATGVRFGFVSEGANSVGAHLAGVLPHRSLGGKVRDNTGMDVSAMLKGDLDVLMLFGVEPGADSVAIDTKAQHGFVAAFTPYRSDALEQCSDLLLPIGTYAETSGTFVNCEGRWQSFAGVANPVGAARPGWKILRVLGSLLQAEDFDYQSSEEVRDELLEALGNIELDNTYHGNSTLVNAGSNGSGSLDLDIPMYQIDGLVRHAAALQLTPEAFRATEDAE
jgi:NADH-quinone oxidoreductase subunit G